MSAYIVGKAHIDYLVSAGMSRSIVRNFGPLKWFDGDPDNSAYQRGVAIPVTSIEWANEHRQELNRQTAGRVGAMLMAENQRSIDHRYDEDEIEEPYLFSEVEGPFNPIDVLMAIRGYVYQSCEHPEWRTSEAKQFVESLEGSAISTLTEDSDYWHISSGMIRYQRGVNIMDLLP